jgi:hypothetical protein
MTKINSGAGSPRPTGGPDSTEQTKDTSAANETTHTPTHSESSSIPQKTTTGDKYATGDLHATGNRVKSHLDSELESKKGKDVNKEKELARQVAEGQQRFAPPYVPVGPVVMGDNVGVPSQPPSSKELADQVGKDSQRFAPSINWVEGPVSASKEKEIADQAAKGQPRFAPPYVPVGPVVTGDNIATPGTAATGETRQMNLKPDQFQINDQGNLVITNEKLVEYFKSLKENGQEIMLGITQKKPEGQE